VKGCNPSAVGMSASRARAEVAVRNGAPSSSITAEPRSPDAIQARLAVHSQSHRRVDA
jgi:hypothetical protein